MKKVFMLILSLVMIILASAVIVTGIAGNNNATLWKANLEALSEIESPYCHNGGPGATQCSISAGTNIVGVGVSAGCSVTCGGNTYACCSLRCICVSYPGI